MARLGRGPDRTVDGLTMLPEDPAIVRSPFGPEVDGRRLLGEAVGFGRSLRAARLSIDLGAAVDFARALTLVDIADREQVRAAGAAIFVRRRDDRPIYDAAFDRWWRRRGSRLPSDFAPSTLPREEAGAEEEEVPGAATPETGEQRTEMGTEERGTPMPSDGDEGDDEAPIEGVVVAPDAYSQGEVLRHREFDRMTPAELREAERLVDLLVPRLERRRTRRYELHSHGRRLAPRAMFRRNLGTGGQLLSWVWRRQIREPRSLVVLCDISGSMERHSRLLLRFVQALSAASEVRTESFVFGTRLTRVTRLLRDRDRDRALRTRGGLGQRLGGRDPDRGVVPDLQPALGAALAAHVRRRHRRVGRLGPRRSGTRRVGDRPAAAQLPPPGLAQPAGRDPRLPAAGRRDAGRVPVHRRLPAGGDRRLARAARRDPGRCSGRRHAARERGRGTRLAAGCGRSDRRRATLDRRW